MQQADERYDLPATCPSGAKLRTASTSGSGMKVLACALVLGSALTPLRAGAWGDDGHRVVGAMADQLIRDSNAQQQVAALLLPGESLEKISVWLDCTKGKYCGAKTAEMTAYTAANPRHSQYHYANIPYQIEHYRDGAVGSTKNDIVQTLKQAIAVLQGRDDEASNPRHFTRRQALILLVHLAADIHQPLHIGVPYVGKDGGFVVPENRRQIDGVNIFDTRGGNDLLVDRAVVPAESKAQAGAWSFHAYWDITTVDNAMRASSARTPQQFAQDVLAGQPPVASNTGDPVSWPYQWADDALRTSKLAHAGLVPGAMSEQTSPRGKRYEVWALALPQDYALPGATIARIQLTKSGYRLAAVLQAIWP
jgi:hypothetical protein